jgi:hypothetical protein
MNKTFDERLTFLEDSKDSHYKITALLSTNITVPCIYAFMVLKRSLSLVFGFTELTRNSNFLCAAPLIRLQLDNLLRFHAAFMAQDPNQFVVDVIQGKQVRQLQDQFGKKMTDVHLQDVLAIQYPWLKDVYASTSGYVHLSEKHFFNAIRASDGGPEGMLDIYIGPDDKMLTDEVYEAAIEDMILVTHALLTFAGDWAQRESKS